ncbi:ABC-2 and Plant PDR ABC-type transporter family protein [Striga asiatica]|uniref:ABC-2 and Plant PDR ABC-type transporter family protein n=1 Tax=Striga asiatica TaxID=4170 RepID=A0A5A7PLZ7_STRAF|nr:ABC-2 and Plant PDR ABC-type transporter family protein [Striga asiatica]
MANREDLGKIGEEGFSIIDMYYRPKPPPVYSQKYEYFVPNSHLVWRGFAAPKSIDSKHAATRYEAGPVIDSNQAAKIYGGHSHARPSSCTPPDREFSSYVVRHNTRIVAEQQRSITIRMMSALQPSAVHNCSRRRRHRLRRTSFVFVFEELLRSWELDLICGVSSATFDGFFQVERGILVLAIEA